MAGIIKAHDTSPGPASKGIVFHFEEVTARANSYLAQVQRDAQGIVDRAKDDADKVHQRAAQQGQQAALDAARQVSEVQLQRRLKTLVPAIGEAVKEIHHAKHVWLKHWETCVVHLATAIASHVIRRQMQQQPEISVALIREALELAAGQGRITLRLNPQDHGALADQATLLTDQFTELGTPDIVADASVAAGGCRVETEFGSIDQQIESQLERIREELLS